MPPVDQIWFDAARTLEAGKPFAMATVINVRGSTPREVGAKMIVHEGGQLGTIGGGCGEAEVFRKARLLLEEGQGAGLAEVDLTGDFDQQAIGTCGGVMDVFIDLWSPASDLSAAHTMADAARRNLPCALVTLVDAGGTTDLPLGARSVLKLDSANRSVLPIRLPETAIAELAERAHEAAPRLLELGGSGALRPVTHIEPTGAPRLFLDPIVGALRLVIIGAGHIAQPLCAVAAMLGFHTTVIDDRASFASRERFPTADEILARPFVAAIDSLILDRHCYVVIVTRGHAFDEESLKAVLRQRAAYVGMIGSRRRVRATLDRILESARDSGIEPATLDEVHAPIGLDIRAETPEEIAISIMAEIIRERRSGTRDSLSLGVKLGRLAAR
jgi:xanthine dehydrogenase accessory factor